MQIRWILFGIIMVACQGQSDALKKVADIVLPGAAARFDYQALDPLSHRLYIAHLGDDSIVVFDTKNRKAVGEIKGVRGAHGVLWVPEENRIYASATNDREVVAIDPKTLKILLRCPAGQYPDGLAYDPKTRKLYVSDEHGGADIVIDAKTLKKLRAIPLGGEVGNTRYDPATSHIFVAVGETDELAEIDPIADKVIKRTKLEGASNPHGLLIDHKHQLAFISCEGNNKVVALSMTTMQVVDSKDVGQTPDVLAYDTEKGWLYVACEGGPLSIFMFANRSLHRIADVDAGPNAHSVSVDFDHFVYLPLKDIGGKPVLRIMSPDR